MHLTAPPPAPATNTPQSLPPPPESSVNFYELSFGTVAGLCAGVFVKKGAKIVGFFLGGIFVLLQYFAHASFIRVDWTRFSTRFEDLFYTTSTDVKTGETVRKAPSVASLVRWIVDFLTADFQQRASFVAGFALGLRIA
ncbi:FUN14 family-domain-containing protein [Irpex rosettiformis]|uniref:FUN14 family-domain-containing protein n=1 Tax=Irpex rosettiformis TaxID=378272 RepID=A0ACB8UGV8_9APHY|nr:FUN14 family-domain-containing protein [Irpex rosettiformis]